MRGKKSEAILARRGKSWIVYPVIGLMLQSSMLPSDLQAKEPVKGGQQLLQRQKSKAGPIDWTDAEEAELINRRQSFNPNAYSLAEKKRLDELEAKRASWMQQQSGSGLSQAGAAGTSVTSGPRSTGPVDWTDSEEAELINRRESFNPNAYSLAEKKRLDELEAKRASWTQHQPGSETSEAGAPAIAGTSGSRSTGPVDWTDSEEAELINRRQNFNPNAYSFAEKKRIEELEAKRMSRDQQHGSGSVVGGSAAGSAPQTAAGSAPQTAAGSAPQTAAGSAPQTAAGSAPQQLRSSEEAEYNRLMTQGGTRQLSPDEARRLDDLGARKRAHDDYANPGRGSPGYRGGAPAGGGMAAAGAVPQNGYVRDEGYKLKANNKDKCSMSVQADGSWGCSSTHTMVNAANGMQMASQILGPAMIMAAGASANTRAQQSGSMSGAYDASADVAMKSANISTGFGAIQAATGVGLLTMGMKHNKQADKAAAMGNAKVVVKDRAGAGLADVEAGGGQKDAAAATMAARKALNSFNMNKAGSFNDAVARDPNTGALNDPSVRARERHVTELLNDVSNRASEEQAAAADKAKTQGIQSTISGMAQLIQGYAQRQAAKAMQQTSKQLKRFETRNPVAPLPLLPPGNPMMPPNFNGIAAPVIGGLSATPGPEQTSSLHVENEKDDEEKPLPLGLEQKGFQNLPTPGPQLVNAPGAPDSGSGAQIAGAGIAGGGSDHAGDGGPAGALPREADPRYGAGEGAGAYGAGGGGGGDGNAAPDLSGMMEKLMAGQKQEEVQKPNIEEFGREPASELPYSFLDKNVNIFQRVHQAYQQKAKAGRVALF